MNMVVIGSGNVAWHLALALQNAGHNILAVYSRNISHAKALTQRLYKATPVSTLDFRKVDASLFLIAIKDQAIEKVAKQLVLPNQAMVVHTSGSASMDTLKHINTDHIGVFYPLQTFSKTMFIECSNVPFLIESDDALTKKVLAKIGSQLSNKVIHINAQDRKSLHISAVFAANFTNHLFTISEKLLADKQLDFDLLKPLITETIGKSLQIGPKSAQTGPAIRKDIETIGKHLQYLENNEDYAAIYRLMTQNIIDTYKQ